MLTAYGGAHRRARRRRAAAAATSCPVLVTPTLMDDGGRTAAARRGHPGVCGLAAPLTADVRRRLSVPSPAPSVAMMRTIAILPIKSFGAAKQRLADCSEPGRGRALAQAMFLDVLASLRHVPELDAIAVVTADSVAQSAARGDGACCSSTTAEERPVGRRRDRDPARRSPSASTARCWSPATPRCSTRAEVPALLARAEADGSRRRSCPTATAPAPTRCCCRRRTRSTPSFGPGSLERHRGARRGVGRPSRGRAPCRRCCSTSTRPTTSRALAAAARASAAGSPR